MRRVILDGEETPFMITKNGMLYREDTGNWYKPFENCGYLSYHLKWKNKTYPKRIHRLVAEAYIPNPENKPFVHHKDHNRYNNRVKNLEWATSEENKEHARINALYPRKDNNIYYIRCKQLDMTFTSTYKAAEYINEHKFNFTKSVTKLSNGIRKNINGYAKSAYGYTWEKIYLESFND